MLITRRNFLQTAMGSAFLMAYPNFSQAAADLGRRRLIIILLRGGLDGIAALPPVGDKDLGSLRRNIQINDPPKLDGIFAINPAMNFMRKAYAENMAAFVHATSFPYTGRSHFDGQNLMEGGASAPNLVSTGWVGRAMAAAKLGSIAFSLPIPLILRGNRETTNHFPSEFLTAPDPIYSALHDNWHDDPAFADIADKLIEKHSMNVRGRSQTSLVSFASDQMGKENGPRVGLLDLVGFDTHALQGNESGHQSNMIREIDLIMSNVRNQMNQFWNDTIVVTVTEFGRTASENGTKGTDHGYASCIMLAGGLLKKAQVVTDWPGLKPSSLYDGRDLKMTIDARDIYSEVVSKVFNLDPGIVSKDVFLGYKPKRDWGLLRA